MPKVVRPALRRQRVEAYLRDRSMSELLNREFRVLGKVARHLPPGSQEKVDLLPRVASLDSHPRCWEG